MARIVGQPASFLAVTCLENLKTGILQSFNHDQANQRIIVCNPDARCKFCHHC